MKLSNLLSIIIFASVLIPLQKPVMSDSLPEAVEVPTLQWQNTRLPDWNQITFSNMPSVTDSGSFEVPPSVINQLGYDPSRSWYIGQKPDSFTMLGDFQDSFALQSFSLSQIADITNLNLETVTLNDFGVMKFQTLESLVDAVPELKKLKISEVTPIDDLLSQPLFTRINFNQTIGNLLRQSPNLGKLSFESLNLKSYNLDAIPGLTDTNIASFDKWQGLYINEIPGLNDVPFSQFPNPINSTGTEVGIIDIAFGRNEQKRDRTISGSNKEGFRVPCMKDCAHVELSGSPSIKVKAWISGKYQLVRGGKGILGSVNDGKEPTGRHPFGSAFKVAVWEVSETKGTMFQTLFFRVCMRNSFVDLGCTPYIIGPVPFMTYREKDPIFLGLTN